MSNSDTVIRTSKKRSRVWIASKGTEKALTLSEADGWEVHEVVKAPVCSPNSPEDIRQSMDLLQQIHREAHGNETLPVDGCILPCDVKVGNTTIKAGLPVSTVLKSIRVHAQARTAFSSPTQKATGGITPCFPSGRVCEARADTGVCEHTNAMKAVEWHCLWCDEPLLNAQTPCPKCNPPELSEGDQRG